MYTAASRAWGPAMSQTVLHQFLPGARSGDAITDQALMMRRWLRDMGYTSQIFAQHIDSDVETDILPLSRHRLAPDETLAIYHHSIGSDVLDFLKRRKFQLILIYHNITPPEFFAGIDQPVEPGKKLSGAVVSVQDYRNAIGLSHGMNVHCAGNTTEYCCLLVVIGQAFSGSKDSAAIGKLNDHRRVGLPGGFEYGIDSIGADYVDGRQGKIIFIGVLEKVRHLISVKHSGSEAGGSPR